MKSKIEDWLIKRLSRKSGCLYEHNFDRDKKTVNVGLFGMRLWFMDGLDCVWLHVLIKCFKYQLFSINPIIKINEKN